MNSNILVKLIKFGIGFVLFIPLYVGGSFFFPFIFPKIWLFQLVIEITSFFYVILALRDARYRPKFNLITCALLALTAILIITSLTGIDTFRSFWGNTERMSGIITWFHFVVFAIILSAVLKTDREWKNYFGIAVVVSILEFFYVLAQYFGANFVLLPGSVIGTIGNTDLLGSYAIFSAFFALYLWQSSKLQAPSSKLKWLWAAAFFLNIGTLLLASSRGALIGFGVGIFIYLLTQLQQKPQARKFIVLAIVTPVILYALLWLMRGTGFIKNNIQLSRIVNVSLKDDTVQQRFTEWSIAWDAFKSRPIFGYGPNNYLYLHNAYLNPRVYNLRETNFDRAHNAYLDYASMSGILGLIGYVLLIAILFLIFFKSRLWTWVALTAAYAVQSFFVFDSPASYIALFLTIGFAIYTANQAHHSSFIIHNSRFNQQTILTVSALYLLLTAYFVWQVSIKQALANYKFAAAFSGINSGKMNPAEAFKSYNDSLKYETLGTTEFRNQYISWLQKNLSNFQPENRLEVINFGINELEKEAASHPLVFSYLNLGQMYYMEASGISSDNLKPGLYQKSARAYEKAIELAPRRLEVYYSYLQLTLTVKDYSRGIEIIKKTTEVAPNYPKNWWYLGIANIAAGKNEDGIRSVNKALSMYYAPNITAKNNGLDLEYDINKILSDGSSAMPPKQEILGLVNPYIIGKRWKELLLLYLGAKMEDPNDVGVHKSLALVYYNLGLNDELQKELEIIEQLAPK